MQTEDSGVSNPHIFTHLFHGGVILSSRRLDYDSEAAEEVVKSLMQSQHKAVLKDLKQGTFDEKIDAYLGDHADLKPRKTAPGADTDEFNQVEAAPPARGQGTLRAAIPEVPSEIAASATERVEQPEFAAVPEAITDEVDNTTRMPTQTPPHRPASPSRPAPVAAVAAAATSKPGVATVFGPGPGAGRPRIPTPIAVPVDEEALLGEPMVTFTSARSRDTEDNIPKAIPTESSGSYSHVRRKGPTEADRPATLAPPVAPSVPPPIPATARPAAAKPTPARRPAGKAANAEPGRPRSSVVVSRPAVIIGAPPKVVGGGGGEATRQQSRRARPDPGLFGKDLISEKSLDEVILAYLSEDGGDD